MAAQLLGPRAMGMGRDSEGHRFYKIKFLVKTERSDGPFVALNCPGLPLPGSVWNFGDDYDPWAWCRPDATVSIHDEKEGDPNRYWIVEMTFSTKLPESAKQRCQDTPIEDPLSEPPRVSGGFTRRTVEATKNRFGNPILTSSHELIRGPGVEFDESTGTVHIEMNVSTLNLALVASMIDTVNAYELWGLPRRCVKLGHATWSKEYYGTCFVYYKWAFDFDVDKKTFDRDLLDEGTKALHGHWDLETGEWSLLPVWATISPLVVTMPDRFNPNHFSRFKDRNGENCRVVLDGEGKPHNPALDVTEDCLQSPTGAPTNWTVAGFPAGDAVVGHNALCIWIGIQTVPGEGDMDLQLLYNDPNWEFTHQLYPGSIWTQAGNAWHDMGPNGMVRTVGADGPAVITLTRVETPPGKVHVEKYPESDFLLLGIPVTF